VELPGQTDVFGLLDEPLPVPPITVYTCVWAERGCGWCGSTATLGGGACRNPDNSAESFFYSYCARCYKQYGTPKVTRPGVVVIDRTQKVRPGDAPTLIQKES
jgi:hypothetical protein